MIILAEYRRTTEDLEVTDSMIKDFNEAGYVVVRNLLDPEEVNKLKRLFQTNPIIQKNIWTVLSFSIYILLTPQFPLDQAE